LDRKGRPRGIFTRKEFFAVIALIVFCTLPLLIPKLTEKNRAEITWNGHTETVSIDTANTYTMRELFGKYTNRLPDMVFETDEDGIKVVSSDCPGGDCIRQGHAPVIICVPNRVTVRLVNNKNEEPLFDAVV
jgi:hypothetical protein